MTHALLVIDVQNDFCEGGSLAVQGGAKVASDISNFLTQTVYDVVVASRDYHQPNSTNCGHIALPPDVPDYKTTWPVHCIQNTYGAEYHTNLILPSYTYHLVKGDGEAAYSAFEGRLVAGGATLDELFNDLEVDEISIVGLALDYCVAQTAQDASIFLGARQVNVISDLTAPVTAESGAAAVEQLKNYGINFVSSTELLT